MTHEGQCLHTFEITQRRCLLCTGHDSRCPHYKPQPQKTAPKAVSGK